MNQISANMLLCKKLDNLMEFLFINRDDDMQKLFDKDTDNLNILNLLTLD